MAKQWVECEDNLLPVEVQFPECKTKCHYRIDRHQWACAAWKRVLKTKKENSVALL